MPWQHRRRKIGLAHLTKIKPYTRKQIVSACTMGQKNDVKKWMRAAQTGIGERGVNVQHVNVLAAGNKWAQTRRMSTRYTVARGMSTQEHTTNNNTKKNATAFAKKCSRICKLVSIDWMDSSTHVNCTFEINFKPFQRICLAGFRSIAQRAWYPLIGKYENKRFNFRRNASSDAIAM